MIVSIHVPKTAGKSFRLRLAAAYGSRLLEDYADWVGYDPPESHARSAAEARGRREQLQRDYDVIHGHFIADKYAGLFLRTDLVAFFRDPCQQAVSHYEFLMRHPEIAHPGVTAFHDLQPTLPEFIAALPSFQSMFLGSVAVGDLAVVGLTEQFERGIALFETVFGCKLPQEAERGNVNPHRAGDRYPIEPAVRRAIDIHRAADVELYRRACDRFARLAARHGV
jgi:hypothetical protein